MNFGILQNEYENFQCDVIQLEAGYEVLLLSVLVEHSDSYFTLLILMTTNQGLEHFSNNYRADTFFTEMKICRPKVSAIMVLQISYTDFCDLAHYTFQKTYLTKLTIFKKKSFGRRVN